MANAVAIGTQGDISPESKQRIGIVEAAKVKFNDAKTRLESFKQNIQNSYQEYEEARDREGLSYTGLFAGYKNAMAFADYQVVKLVDRVSEGRINLGNQNGFSGVRLESAKDYQNLMWNSGARVALFATTPYAQIAYSLYRTGRFGVMLAQNREQIIGFAKSYMASRGNKPFNLGEFAETFHLKQVLVGATASAVMSIALQNAGVSMGATIAFAGITENLKRNKSTSNFTPEQKANFEKIEALFIGMRISNAGNGILHSRVITDWIGHNFSPEKLLDVGVTTAHAEIREPQIDIVKPVQELHQTVQTERTQPVVSLRSLTNQQPSIAPDVKSETNSDIAQIAPSVIEKPVDVGFTEYHVERGDTLNKIAAKFGYKTWKELAPFNEFQNPDLIRPGEVIRIPTHDAVAPIITSQNTVGVVIHQAENVEQISQRLDVEPETVRVLNPSINLHPVTQDQVIIVPSKEVDNDLDQIRITPVKEHQETEYFEIKPENNNSAPNVQPVIQTEQIIEPNQSSATVEPTILNNTDSIQPAPHVEIVESPQINIATDSNNAQQMQELILSNQIAAVSPDIIVNDFHTSTSENIVSPNNGVTSQPDIKPADVIQEQNNSVTAEDKSNFIVRSVHAQEVNPETVITQPQQATEPKSELVINSVKEIEPASDSAVLKQGPIEVTPVPQPQVKNDAFELSNANGIVRVKADPSDIFHSDNPNFWEQEERGELKQFSDPIPSEIQKYIAPKFNHTQIAVAQDGRADSCFVFAMSNAMAENGELQDPAMMGEMILRKVVNTKEFHDFLNSKYSAEEVEELLKMDRPGKISLLTYRAMQFGNSDLDLKHKILGDFKYIYDIYSLSNISSGGTASSQSQSFADFIQRSLAGNKSVILDLNVFLNKDMTPAEHAVNVIGIKPAQDGQPAKLIVVEANRWQSRKDSNGTTLLEKYLNEKDESGRFGIFDATPVPGTQSILEIPLNEKNMGIINQVIVLEKYEGEAPRG